MEVLRLHRAAREPAAQVGGEGPQGCAGTPSRGRCQRQAGRASPWGWDGRLLTPGSRNRRARVGGRRWQGFGRERGTGPGPIWLCSEVAWVLCPLVRPPGEPQGPSWPAAFLPGCRGCPEPGSLVTLPPSRRALPRPCSLWCSDSVLPSKGGRVWAAEGAAGPREAGPPRPQPHRKAEGWPQSPRQPRSTRVSEAAF